MSGYNLPNNVSDRMLDEMAGYGDEMPECPYCPICGDKLVFEEGWKRDEWHIECPCCGILTMEFRNPYNAISAAEYKEFENVPECPVCDNINGLKIHTKGDPKAEKPHRVECECGVSSTWEKTKKKAVEAWYIRN